MKPEMIDETAAPRPSGELGRPRFAWGPLLAVAVLIAATGSIFWLHQPQAPTIGGPFQLIDAKSGRQVTDADFRGK